MRSKFTLVQPGQPQVPTDAFLPQNEYFHSDSWKGGLDASDAPEDEADGQSLEMQDVEVTKDDRLIVAPGVTVTETLIHAPTQVFLHAGSKFSSSIIFVAAPFLGVKDAGATQWFDAGLYNEPFGFTNYAGILLMSNGMKGVYARKPGKLQLDLITGAPPAFALAVFANRVVLGGTLIDGSMDFMGIQWSDSSNDYKGWDIALGAAGQSLIGSMRQADKIMDFASLGFETLVVLCRRSIWIGVQTGDEFQPIRFTPRLEDTGCSHRKTIVPTEFGVLFLSDDGVRLFTGSEAPIVSEAINSLLGTIDDTQDWSAGFDPKRKRYYLHGPNGTWVLDLVRRRWFKWLGVSLGSVFFPAQTNQITWDEAVGTWDAQTLTWWQLLPQESGGKMFFVKDTRLGFEDPTVRSFFGIALDPRWFSRRTVAENQDVLITALGSRLTYEADADAQVEVWLPDKPDGNFEPVATGALVAGSATKRAWIPYIHTGRGIGLGLRILSGLPRIRKISAEFQRTSLPWIATSELGGGGSGTQSIQSDAIMKPRIIFTDGYGTGKLGSLGYSADPVTVDPITDWAAWIANSPFFQQLWRVAGHSSGRYLFSSAHDVSVTVSDPAFPGVLSTIYQRFEDSWDWNEAGGRGGNGTIVSKAGGSPSTGNWLGVPFLSDSPVDAGGIVYGFDLQGMTIPVGGLPIIAVAEVMTRTGFTAHGVLWINEDYTLEVRDSGLTVFAGPSIVTVPPTGKCSVELQYFLSTRDLSTGQQQVPTGFVIVRLYTAADTPVGVEAIYATRIPTLLNSRSIAGIAWGSQATNAGSGYDGLLVDCVVVYDNGGTVKRYLYDVRVGTAQVIGDGDVQQSIPVGSAQRWQNVGRKLNSLTDFVAYNRLAVDQMDLYRTEPARSQAAEILAVGVVGCVDSIDDDLSGNFGHLQDVIRSVGIDTLGVAGQVAAGPPRENAQLILEKDPATNLKFEPSAIGNTVQVGVKSTQQGLGVMQLALEYVHREQKITDIEHGPFAPVASFNGVSAGLPDNVWNFADTSIDWDGTVVSRAWDLGDGNTAGNVTTVNHTFLPGTYTVRLTITDNSGLTDTMTQVIVVPNQPPVANFSWDADPGDPSGQTIAFTDLSTDPDGTVVSWVWDFGDLSASSSAQNPTHVYAVPGTYTVAVTVTDNLGAIDTVSADVTVPIGGAGDCTLSADALADTANVQGDDFNGGNPPLPSYADTAAFDVYYNGSTFRDAYFNAYAGSGTDHRIDTTNQFNGHPTLQMDFGAGHFGAGWDTQHSDDGSPTETATKPGNFWFRRVIKTDAGVMSDAGATTAFTGLTILDINGSNIEYAINIRQGRIKLDVSHRPTSDGHAFQTDTFDVGPETDLIGTAGWKELIGHYTKDLTARTTRLKLWWGDACSLASAAPSYDSGDIDSHIGTSGSSLTNELLLSGKANNFGQNFTPSGAIKHLNVALWEQEPETVNANPYGVGSP